MKKTAVLLYNICCLFELAVALEMLQMAEKPVVYFAKDLKPIRTEEGMLIIADNIITSVAFGFRQWAMAIRRELNIEIWPKSFDL